MVNTFTQLAWDGPTLEDARHLIRLAVREDLSNQQDWTTMATVGDERTSKAAIVARQPGIVAGIGIVAAAVVAAVALLIYRCKGSKNRLDKMDKKESTAVAIELGGDPFSRGSVVASVNPLGEKDGQDGV